jgi:hypothetical protein
VILLKLNITVIIVMMIALIFVILLLPVINQYIVELPKELLKPRMEEMIKRRDEIALMNKLLEVIPDIMEKQFREFDYLGEDNDLLGSHLTIVGYEKKGIMKSYYYAQYPDSSDFG